MELELQADFQGLSRQEIEDNFLPETNTWLKLIELAKKKATKLEIKNRGEERLYAIDPDIAELMIKHKVLPNELFEQFQKNEGNPQVYKRETQAKQIEGQLTQVNYQQIAVSLLGLVKKQRY